MTNLTDKELAELTIAVGDPNAAAEIKAVVNGAAHATLHGRTRQAVKSAFVEIDTQNRILTALETGSATLTDKTKAALTQTLADVATASSVKTKLAAVV